jgi:hypothetical protein
MLAPYKQEVARSSRAPPILAGQLSETQHLTTAASRALRGEPTSESHALVVLSDCLRTHGGVDAGPVKPVRTEWPVPSRLGPIVRVDAEAC